MTASKKTNAKNLPSTLTDDPKVISSMKAIQRAGFWAFIIALFAPLILVLSLMMGGEPNSSLYVLPIVAIYLAYSGWKMNRLEGGTSITVMLFINILLSLLMIYGLFPILLLIMSIIALAKIGAYQRWRKGGKAKTTTNHTANLKKVTCDVHILDPMKGELVEERTIDGATYNKFVAKSGKLFAIRSYDDGKAKTAIINEDIYRATRKAFGIK